MPDSTIKIINGREGRRRWGMEEKLRIVAETHEPGATVRAVAARHNVYASLLHTWRRQVRDEYLVVVQAPHFVPMRLTDQPSAAPATRQRLITIPRATQSRSSCPMAAAYASATASI